MKYNLSTLNIIKLAYAAWSFLYIVETLSSIGPANREAIAGLSDLNGLVPDQMISDVSSLATALSIIILVSVIFGIWRLILALPGNKSWTFFTFISTCILSMLVNVWAILFPAEDNSFSSSLLLNFSYLTLLLIMLTFSCRLREEINE